MYAPKQFCEERPEILVDAMRAIQFGALVVAPDGLPSATHLPMIVRHGDDAITLESHVATGNPLWKTAVQGVEALAIFQGPQA
jgi:transcriptional regulator